MTINKPRFDRDSLEDPQENLITFSEEKFRSDVIFYTFLITSSKYLELPYLPKKLSEDN